MNYREFNSLFHSSSLKFLLECSAVHDSSGPRELHEFAVGPIPSTLSVEECSAAFYNAYNDLVQYRY